jgi:HlyD family secretion protein
MIYRYGLPLLALGLLAYTLLHATQTDQVPQPAPAAATAARPFPHGIAGSGVVEAQTGNIEIGSPTPGIVVAVPAVVGQTVTRGSPLFRLDDRQMQSELKVREASLTTARAKLTRLESSPREQEVRIKDAAVHAAEAGLKAREGQLARGQRLRDSNLISAEAVSRFQYEAAAAQATLDQARADADLLRAGARGEDRVLARTEVAQACALVEQARGEIERLTIRAPISGQVLQVNVQPGKFASAPQVQPLVVLGNLDRLYLRVDIDEHDISRFRIDAPAQAVLRGWPQDEFSLTFVRIEPYVVPKRSLSGNAGERVDTRALQVIYALESSNPTLYVGQQLDAFIRAEP